MRLTFEGVLQSDDYGSFIYPLVVPKKYSPKVHVHAKKGELIIYGLCILLFVKFARMHVHFDFKRSILIKRNKSVIVSQKALS